MDLGAVDLYCFSGTGNTLIASRKMVETFEARGVESKLIALEKADPAKVRFDRTIGLSFPVACQSTYPFVWRFVEAMPEGGGAKVFMMDTLQAFSGGVVGPLGRMLRRKGYATIGAAEIPMPSNFLPGKIDEEKNEAKRRRGLEKSEAFAEALLDGQPSWGRVPVFSDVMYALSRWSLTWKMMAKMGRRFTADPEKCVKCGLCARLCPVGNIAMDDLPTFGGRCCQCMRCIGVCPEEAIHVPGKTYQVYRQAKAKDFIDLASSHGEQSGRGAAGGPEKG